MAKSLVYPYKIKFARKSKTMLHSEVIYTHEMQDWISHISTFVNIMYLVCNNRCCSISKLSAALVDKQTADIRNM